MAKKLGAISRKTMEKLEQFDYGDLYSIRRGAISGLYWDWDDAIEIRVGVNRAAHLYIIVDIGRGSHFKTFDFDQLREAIDWVKRRVEVIG